MSTEERMNEALRKNEQQLRDTLNRIPMPEHSHEPGKEAFCKECLIDATMVAADAAAKEMSVIVSHYVSMISDLKMKLVLTEIKLHEAKQESARLESMLNELGFCPKDGESMPCTTCGAGL